MQEEHDSPAKRRVLAIIVLYRRAPSKSQSLCSLLHILAENPRLSEHLSLILYDNSPDRHEVEAAFNCPLQYVHQPENPGLAAAYNYALGEAERSGIQWLLLLDQDTTLNRDFVAGLIDCIAALNQTDVASIVPKILLGDRILSPESNFRVRLRHQHIRSYNSVTKNLVGVQPPGLSAYNSGAVLRVSALRSIGGFPQEFWLDYLDHAVFHALSARNYRMYVMREKIEHEPSQAETASVPEWRERNLLAAQTRFIQQTGTFLDRLLYRIWLLRYSRSLWLRCPYRRLWKEALWQALLLRTGKAGLKP